MWGVLLGEEKGVVRENGNTEQPCEEKGAGEREGERASRTERCREGEEEEEEEVEVGGVLFFNGTGYCLPCMQSARSPRGGVRCVWMLIFLPFLFIY